MRRRKDESAKKEKRVPFSSLYQNGGNHENSKPEGRIFFDDLKKKRERDGLRGWGGERRIEGGR